MSEVSRREVVAAAAGVAGVVALTGTASAQPEKAARAMEGSEFILKLNGIKLPQEVEQKIAGELQAALMREVARVDLKGGLTVKIPDKDWIGIWVERLGRQGEIPRVRTQVG